MTSESKRMEVDTAEASALGEASLPLRIAEEHSYSRLAPFRSSPGSGGKDSSFSTVVLFSERVRKRQPKVAKAMQVDHGESRYDRL